MAYTTINKSTAYFNTKLYTGNGSGGTGITGVGFQPDLLWIKRRSDSNAHHLVDAVSGAGYALYPDMTAAQSASQITSLDSDGFTLAGGGAAVNANSSTYASWNWKANGAGSANTDGSINSIATSANTTSGFSIVKYTGNGSTNQTVGHGLGAEPDFIIIKQTNTTRNWPTYSKAMGNGVAFLDITDAWNGGSGYTNYWYTSGMTSTTFGISNNDNNNQSGGTYIAYVFSSKTGYSKFGSYISNNSSNGVFVYTGFKPKFILIKAANEAVDWRIYDSERAGYNNKNYYVEPNTQAAESTTDSGSNWDMLSNGFKFYTSEAEINGGAGNSYIYMALGQSLVGSNNIPCTAR